MFVYVCCGSVLNSVSCLLAASRVLLDSGLLPRMLT